MSNSKEIKGNRGGYATARGEESTAVGGDAGAPGPMPGGRGGDARAVHPRSTVIGGSGGRGGAIEGMSGMDVSDDGPCIGDHIEGGMGGEAPQHDGRGGRGGLPGGAARFGELLGFAPLPHMKRPYWPDNRPHFGRGGDSPDTPLYKARRLIVEMIKAEQMGTPRYFTTDVWYERDAVPVETINAQLARRGITWRASIEDHEYVFEDINVG